MSKLSRAIDEATRPEEDDDAYWAAVEGIRQEGPAEAWRLVAQLTLDPRPEVRALFPDVMRYFEPHPLVEEVVARLATMLESEEGPVVLRSIASAFGTLHHARAPELLSPLLGNADARVRCAAVQALVVPAASTPPKCFIRASSDSDDDVRNWATFALCVLLGDVGDPEAVDTPEIRDALVARLDDEVAEIRGEAILALATRQDARALPRLMLELREWPEWDHSIEAAQHFATPTLHPLLCALASQHPEHAADLEAAIRACAPRAETDGS